MATLLVGWKSGFKSENTETDCLEYWQAKLGVDRSVSSMSCHLSKLSVPIKTKGQGSFPFIQISSQSALLCKFILLTFWDLFACLFSGWHFKAIPRFRVYHSSGWVWEKNQVVTSSSSQIQHFIAGSVTEI